MPKRTKQAFKDKLNQPLKCEIQTLKLSGNSPIRAQRSSRINNSRYWSKLTNANQQGNRKSHKKDTKKTKNKDKHSN